MGCPIVPPTADAVQACLDWAMMTPDQLVGIEPVRERAITAEKLAINAVMAGCSADAFSRRRRGLYGDAAGAVFDAWRDGQHRRVCGADRDQRAGPQRS